MSAAQNAEVSKPVGRRKRRSPDEIMGRILEAAEAEFTERGFSRATTAAIAKRADVTEAQLFRYFPSKVDIFQAAIFQPLDSQLAEFTSRYIDDTGQSEGIRDRMRDYIAELQTFIADHSKLFMSLATTEAYAPSGAQGVGAIDSLHSYFEQGAAAMTSRVDGKSKVDPQLMVRVSFAAVLANVMFKDWLFPAGMASDDQISSAIIDFVIDGINANNDPELADQK